MPLRQKGEDDYHLSCCVRPQYDEHANQSEGVRTYQNIPYAAEFCPDPTNAYVFAIVAGSYLTLYRCIEEGRVIPIQVFKDSNAEEKYYSMCWSHDPSAGGNVVCVVGEHGIIKIISVAEMSLHKIIRGHGGHINEVRSHPRYPHIVLTASQDESIRMWNVITGTQLFIFAGAEGHRNDAISCDFHPLVDGFVVSGGADNSVRIWSYEKYIHLIEESENWTKAPSQFRTKTIQYPRFVTFKAHSSYVDTVRYWGHLVCSKSSECRIELWRQYFEKDSVDQDEVPLDKEMPYSIATFHYVDKEAVWFYKLSLSLHMTHLAVGTYEGYIYIWDLREDDPVKMEKPVRLRPKLAAIGSSNLSSTRSVALSRDGEIVIAACDDGTIWRWDYKENIPVNKGPRSSFLGRIVFVCDIDKPSVCQTNVFDDGYISTWKFTSTSSSLSKEERIQALPQVPPSRAETASIRIGAGNENAFTSPDSHSDGYMPGVKTTAAAARRPKSVKDHGKIQICPDSVEICEKAAQLPNKEISQGKGASSSQQMTDLSTDKDPVPQQIEEIIIDSD